MRRRDQLLTQPVGLPHGSVRQLDSGTYPVTGEESSYFPDIRWRAPNVALTGMPRSASRVASIVRRSFTLDLSGSTNTCMPSKSAENPPNADRTMPVYRP